MTQNKLLAAASPRPRVVHLIGQLGFGGSERQLFLLLEHADHDRFEHHVVVFNPSPNRVYDEDLKSIGVHIWGIPETRKGAHARALFLLRLFRRLRPLIVHSWTVHDNPYAGIIGRLAGVPVRWGSLRGSPELAGFRGLHRWLRELSLRGVDRLVVNSCSIQNQLHDRGIAPGKISILKNCVDHKANLGSEGNRLDLAHLGISPTDRLVGAIGNLRRVKNHLLLVRSMARVLPNHPDVKAIIVGQSLPSELDTGEELRSEIGRLGLADKILLAGFRDDIPQILERLTVFCLTSESEGMPNAVLEAMAAGLPVVATRVGGVPELVRHEETGLLVEPGDEDDLAETIERCLSDSSLAQRLGAAGRTHVRAAHDCRRAADRLESLYQQAIEEPGSPAGPTELAAREERGD